jgi:hypothetical protein
MIKEFIPYELALELKQLGFDEPCFGHYVDGELRGIDLGMEELGGIKPYYQRFGFHVLNNHDIDNPSKVVVTAPTFSQAFRWFRDNGKISEIYSQLLPSNKYKWGFKIQGVEGITDGFLTYEEAELECLKKLIEIVKNGGNK